MASPQASVVDVRAPETTRRSVYVVHITPLTGKLTPLARKLHIALGRMAGQQFRRLDESEREEIEGRLRSFIADLRSGHQAEKPPLLLQPRFTTSLRELAEVVGYDPKEARHLYEHLKLLLACRVEYNSLRDSSKDANERELYPDELEVTSNLLSSLVRSGRGLVSWAFDPVVLAVMVMPRTYAQLNLDVLRGVRSYAAVALYENCRRFVGVGRTGAYATEKWRRLLSPTGNVPAWRDNERELNRAIKSAIADLKACDACDIDLEPVKVRLANNQPGLQFLVKLVKQHRLPFGEPVPVDRELRDRLLGLGFAAAEARHILESRDDTYIRSKLDMLAKAREVRNPKGWLIDALAKDYQDEEARAELEAQRRAQMAQRVKDAQEVKDAFAVWQAKRLREQFAELLEDERARWEVQFNETGAGAALGGKARQAAFFGWLARQGHNLLRAEEDADPIVFSTVRPDKLMFDDPSTG